MPRHIARLVVLLAAFGAAAYAAKVFFTADSFYAYGHYRGASVAEIASDRPKFKGAEYCRSCHAERFAEWSAGAHRSAGRGKAVKCEVCHGAAGGRDPGGMFEHVASGADHPAKPRLSIPADSVKLCALCHEKMPGRPAQQPQVELASHAGKQQCTSCHNPHSPRTIRTAAAVPAEAGRAGAGKAAQCAGCHGTEGLSANAAWPNLAGQQKTYLIQALRAYKSGTREHPMMAAAAKALSEREMQELAGHYSGIKKKAGRGAAAAPSTANVSACAACHGADGVSANPAWPNLAGQHKDYLIAALKAYKAGTRKNALMAGVANGVSDAELEALAGYYAGLQ